MESRADMWQSIALGETTDGFGFIVKDFINEAGAQSVTAPGTLKALSAAHVQYGAMPWSDLFGAAISCARDGWMVRPHVYTVFTQNERKYGRMNYGDKLGLTSDGRRIYMEPDGTYKKLGTIIKNPDLAVTLETLALDGVDSLYTGSLASHIVDDVRRNGGMLSSADLADFTLRTSDPLSVTYHGWRVDTPAPPGGGLLVSQILRIAELFDLPSLGHNSPEYIRILAEAMKIALSDKENFVGDPDFFENPVARLLSEDYRQDCARRIRAGEKANVVRRNAGESKHTTHVSAIDQNGMVVSLTHTLGNPSGFIPKDTGFMLNGAMSTFDPLPGNPNSIAPGKRRYSSMAPSIIYDGNKPVFTLGAPGATWIGPAVAQVMMNVLEWGMGIQEAIIAPRIVATSNALDISNRVPQHVQTTLEQQGYEVRRSPLSYAFAGVHGITCFEGRLEGGADPQRDGYAEGIM